MCVCVCVCVFVCVRVCIDIYTSLYMYILPKLSNLIYFQKNFFRIPAHREHSDKQ